MNKLFKLIYVNLLSLFDINKIIIAREDGVKSNLEKRTILAALINVFYAYVMYVILNNLKLKDSSIILVLGFILSTLFVFSQSGTTAEAMLFKNDDNDILFTFPISRYQIIFSKLFVMYLKSLISTILFMLISFLVYVSKVKKVTETMVIMYILVTLVVPIIPIILSTIIAYIDDFCKTKTHNSILYKIAKILVILLCGLLVLILFGGIDFKVLENGLVEVIKTFSWIYPLTYIFHNMVKHESMILFLVMLLIPGLICYLYTFIISNNYLKICSMLKGIKTNKEFRIKKTINLHPVLGMVRKEFISLFKNKIYLSNAFGMSIVASIALLCVFKFVGFDALLKVVKEKHYLNLYVPTILAACSCFGCYTISAMSIEKDNMQILRTMPISIGKVLLSKWITNVLVCTLFVLINGGIVWYYADLSKSSLVYCYVLPFLAIMLISLVSLLLDYRFIEKKETEDNVIIKQRLIVMVPQFMALAIGIVPFFLPPHSDYYYMLGAYAVVFIITIIGCLLYLVINKKKLLDNLFK